MEIPKNGQSAATIQRETVNGLICRNEPTAVASRTKVADDAIETLATNLVISREAIEEASRRGLLSFTKRRNFPCWRFGDARNGCFRRLDGEPFRINGASVKAEADSRGESWHRLIGIDDVVANDRRDVLLTPEGSKDALAALHFAHAEGSLASIGIVAALGSAVTLNSADLESLRGRRIRIFPDIDAAGRDSGIRIGQAIAAVAAETQVFDLTNLHRGDGSEVKDFFDLTRIACDDFEQNRDLWCITDLNHQGVRIHIITPSYELVSLTNSLPPLKSPEYHVSPVYPVSNHDGLEQELQKLGLRNVCAAPNTARKRRLKLNRDLLALEKRIGRRLSAKERILVFETWYTGSLPQLDRTKSHEVYLAKFLSESSKIRVPTGEGGSLEQALKTVSSLSVHDLPELPALPRAPESWRRLAALHRELSRQSANGVYFLGCRDAAKAHPDLNKDSANDISNALASVHVIRVVKTGETRPNGLASEFKYLLPLSTTSRVRV